MSEQLTSNVPEALREGPLSIHPASLLRKTRVRSHRAQLRRVELMRRLCPNGLAILERNRQIDRGDTDPLLTHGSQMHLDPPVFTVPSDLMGKSTDIEVRR